MFSHATKHSLGVRASTMTLALAAIIALAAFLALPSGHVLAKPQAGGVGVQNGVGAVSYSNNLYAFVTGGNHLWVDYWNRSSWQWADQGAPPGGTLALTNAGVGVASYGNNLYVFVKGTVKGTDHLWVDMWNGSSWQWADQGTSPSGIRLLSGVGVASYSNNLYVYLVGANNDLLVDMWNGSHWVWADQGTPSSTVSVGGGVGVASYSNNLYVFVQGYDPQSGLTHMWVDMWNGSSWQWADQGTP